MRFLAIAAALFSMSLSQPAAADVIVEQGSNFGGELGALPGFDYSLGTLDQVTLTISGTENRSGFAHVGPWPSGAAATTAIGWSIDGTSSFSLYGWPLSSESAVLATFAVAIAGAGEATVSSADRLFDMTVTGAATFLIDPSLIPQLGSSGFADRDLVLRFSGPGFFDGSDVSFTSNDSLQPFALGGTCFAGQVRGEESCNFFSYTLSYLYSPPGVPESSTWAMMLLGFGALGFAMRRRRLSIATGASNF
jgi:hypothetical protein